MKYSFSQLMLEIFPSLQGASAPVYNHTPSAIDAAKAENFSTRGDATVANFFVTSQKRAISTGFLVLPLNSAQSRNLQLSKKSI